MRLLRRVKYLFHRGRRERQLAEELAFHRKFAEQEQRDAGLAPEQARRATSLQMGNTTLAREAAHHVWLPEAIEGVAQDLRYAWRGLRRSKALLVMASVSLGLSTGLGTSLFNVVNAAILQPVSATRPGALIRLWVGNGNLISWPNLHDVCDETPGVSCAGYRVNELIWQQADESVRLFGQVVSPHYFTMLGNTVAMGRVFTSETVQQTPDAVVVTHPFWHRQLGGDPHVIGRTLVLTGHPYTIIGVLPRRVSFDLGTRRCPIAVPSSRVRRTGGQRRSRQRGIRNPWRAWSRTKRGGVSRARHRASHSPSGGVSGRESRLRPRTNVSVSLAGSHAEQRRSNDARDHPLRIVGRRPRTSTGGRRVRERRATPGGESRGAAARDRQFGSASVVDECGWHDCCSPRA